MRTVLLSLAAAVAVASPALANEGRVEARGGVYWSGGSSEATAGIAAGYDYDLGSAAFAGVEVSGDKILDSGANRVAFGLTARAGAKLGDNDKLFVAGGYTTKPCQFCDDSVHAGVGYEHSFGSMYGKVEYRHFFVSGGSIDSNAVVAGVGFKF
jgi:outer membrane immunogenic protein